jgi:hypothetical protein
MSRASNEIKKILNRDKIEHPNPDHLWCKRCQRGMTGLDEKGKQPTSVKAGDDCPFCIDLANEGEISREAIGVLMTTQAVTDEWHEKAKLRHRMDELKSIRAIKDTGDVALERVGQQDKIIEELRKQIALMEARNNNKTETVVEKTSTTKGSK